jgi:hypothetical protein
MSINFGKQLFASIESLQPGQLIEFGYNGTRWGVVVTPDWKDNCDCYVFDSKSDVPEELLEWISDRRPLGDGVLFNTFRNRYTFKSFKLENMNAIQNIEFNTYREEREGEVSAEEDGTFVLDIPAGTITTPDGFTLEE